MKLKWTLTIHNVQNQPSLCLINLYKSHINPSLTPWSPLKGFHSRITQPCLQYIYGSNLPNSLYTILHMRYPTVDPYSIVNCHWPKSVDNVSLWHISAECINAALVIVTTILMVRSAAPFWCEAPDPLNLIFCCFFNISSIKFEVLKIPFSVWYTLIKTTWLLYYLLNKTLYRVWRHSIELKEKFLN